MPGLKGVGLGVTANGYMVSFWGDVLKLTLVMTTQLWHTKELKATECTLKMSGLCGMCFMSQ